MKKSVSVLLALVMVFVLAACGDSGSTQTEAPTDNTAQSQEPTAAETEKPTEAPTEEPTEAPTEEPSSGAGTLGDYAVEIKGATLAEDYEGNPAIVITYSWTNNSDDTQSAMWTVNTQAFQDGVELDTAIIADSDVYDSEAALKEVRPGTTIDVQCAFVMTSESVVEFEISELISFDDKIVAMNFDPTTLG